MRATKDPVKDEAISSRPRATSELFRGSEQAPIVNRTDFTGVTAHPYGKFHPDAFSGHLNIDDPTVTPLRDNR
ncbi:hypothetical protein, partial [Cryobacterium sp. MLB-32]|uniref:hypothetical protein n=1 Tax=Cryobacterium sp. MLB-32 TaxID=1529318 RepID=UPI001E418044